MGIDDTQLQKILSELEYLPAEEVKRAQGVATAEGISLQEALLKQDIISDENLGKVIAYSLQLPFVSLAQANIPEQFLKITPQAVAAQYKIVTFGLENRTLKIATPNHLLVDLFEMLAKKAGAKDYRVFFATDHDVDDSLRLYKKELSAAFDNLLAVKAGAAAEVPVAKIVDTLIEYAYLNKASDVHIEPMRDTSLVRFRIDGVLHDAVRLPHALHSQVITRIKVMARLRTDEHFAAQDGRMRVSLAEQNENIDVRVSVVPIMAGEKVVMRLLASQNRQFGLTDLGMQPDDLLKVRGGFTRSYGMVLSTGPTGSGKTTSMYAILKILNTREKNIATIEDPVEYQIDGINQIQANPKANLTFANGLRSILRQDPDTIYVGEIRDEETADIAINSALTGHLVLSTLHTNDAATALPRLIDMKIEPFLVASTVNVIIAQRLVRKICDRCKVSLEVTKTKTGWQGTDAKTAALVSSLSPELVAKYLGSGPSIRTYKGKGCQVCHSTGYRGRVGIFEVLEVTPKIQALITAKADSDTILRQAVQEGMTTMLNDGLAKVQQGVTTIEEVVRVTKE
jgi:type IV pilus assembly protein PilB